MSIVPASGVLRKLYQDAQGTAEYGASSFWQIWLQTEFYEPEYIVVCEFPPDNSLRRVDIVVRRYDENEHTLSSFIFHEAKRHTGSYKIVEEQALHAAELAIKEDKLQGVYAISTVGTRFRAWFVAADERRLQPLHGLSTFADRSQYIDADSELGEELRKVIIMAKESPPLRRAPVVPSQSLADVDMSYEDDEEQEEQNLGDWADQTGNWGVPGQHNLEEGSMWQGQPDDSEQGGSMDTTGHELPVPVEAAAGPSGTSRSHERRRAVTVRKIPHRFRADEYCFTDRKGNIRTTSRDEWIKEGHKETKVWVFNDKYVSNQRDLFQS